MATGFVQEGPRCTGLEQRRSMRCRRCASDRPQNVAVTPPLREWPRTRLCGYETTTGEFQRQWNVAVTSPLRRPAASFRDRGTLLRRHRLIATTHQIRVPLTERLVIGRTDRLEQPAGQRDICPVSVNLPSASRKHFSAPPRLVP